MKKFVWIRLRYVWLLAISFNINIGLVHAQNTDNSENSLPQETCYISLPEGIPDEKPVIFASRATATMEFEYWFDFEILSPTPMTKTNNKNKLNVSVQFEGEAMQVLVKDVDLNYTSTTIPKTLNYRIKSTGKRLQTIKLYSYNSFAEKKNREGTVSLNMSMDWEQFWDLLGKPCATIVSPDEFKKEDNSNLPAERTLYGYNAKLTIRKVPINPVLTTYPDHVLSSEGQVSIYTNFETWMGSSHSFEWFYNYKTSGGTWNKLGNSVSMYLAPYQLKEEADGSSFLFNLKKEAPIVIRASNTCISVAEKDQSPYAATVSLQLKLDAPQLNAFASKPVAPKCAGGSDGEMTIPFSRKLYSGEVVQLTLANLDDPLGYKPSLTLQNGENSATFTGLKAGKYEVKYTNGYILSTTNKKLGTNITNEYNHKAQFTITDPPGLTLSGLSKTDVHCKGGSDGTITLTPSGGTGDIHAWYTASASSVLTRDVASTISGIAAGAYTLELRDGNGCRVTNSTWKMTIAEPTAKVGIQEHSKTNPKGYGRSDGTIQVQASGGAGNFSYIWQKDGVNIQGNGVSLSSLGAGEYTIVTRDGNYSKVSPATTSNTAGCQASVKITLSQPPQILVSVDRTREISCNGLSDGELKATASGGVGKFSYEWAKQTGTSWTPLRYTTEIADGLAAGVYKVSVTDQNGIQVSSVYTLNQPDPVNITFKVTQPSCFGREDGRIEAVAKGGNGGYRYTWLGSPNTESVIIGGIGTYTVRVKDSKGCQGENNVTLGQPALLTATSQIDLPTSADASDGKITIIGSGGTPPYTCFWDYKEIIDNPITGIPADSIPYHVIVKDVHGCQTEVTTRLLYPLGVTIQTKKPISCKGDCDALLEAMPVGGVSRHYSYEWYKIEHDSLVPLDGNEKISLPVGIGKYRVKVTDTENNTAETDYELEGPENLTATYDIEIPSAPFAADGKITIYPHGGTPCDDGSYRYTWDYREATANPLSGLLADSIPYHVIVKDAHNCRIELSPRILYPLIVHIEIRDSISCYKRTDGRLVAVADGGVSRNYRYVWYRQEKDEFKEMGGTDVESELLGEGLYQVKVIDSEQNQTVSSVFFLHHPDTLRLQFHHLDPLCKNDSNGWIDAVVNGGTRPYDYHWNDNNDFKGAKRENLPYGEYGVLIIDAHGCEVSGRDTLIEPDSLQVVHKVDFPSFYGGSDGRILILPHGGTLPYRYTWDYNHAITDSLFGLFARQNPLHVEVTDAHGCRVLDSMYMYNPVTIEIEESGVIICSGQTNAELTAHVKGGAGKPYHFEWFFVEDDFLIRLDETDSLLRNVGVGTYRVWAYDSVNNSGRSVDYTVYSPDSLRMEFEVGDLPCKYDKKGWVQAIPLGGEAPYHIKWFNDSEDFKIENLEEGRYGVRLTDKRGCFIDKKVKVNSPDELLPFIDYRQPLGWQRSDGAAWVVPNGGTLPYHCEWSGFGSQDTIKGIPAGEYTVTVTDKHNCVKTISGIVTEPPLLEVSIVCKKIISCFQGTDGVLEAMAVGGVGNYRYDWFQVAGSRDEYVASGKVCDKIPVGRYKVRVTDANGIIAWSEIWTLTQPPLLEVVVRASALLCEGDTSGSIATVVNGGVEPYSYLWTTGDRTETLENQPKGLYMVSVKDAHGCWAEALGRIESPVVLQVKPDVSEPICHGGTGGIALAVSGGVGKYEFLWNDGNQKAKRNGLVAGIYSVEVKDANGCLWKDTFELHQPELIVVDLGEERTLCRDQQYKLYPRNVSDITHYHWLKDGVEIGNSSSLVVFEAGLYQLEGETKKGCRRSGEIHIYQNNDTVNANFAMASGVEEGVELKVINTSLPMPSYSEWLLPQSDAFKIIHKDNDILELCFNDIGEYIIGLRSVEGECEEILYKQVSVLPAENKEPDTRTSERTIQDIQVWPNPSDGNFHVRIGLSKKAAGLLRLYAMTGTLLREMNCEGSDAYEFNFNEYLPIGVYIIHVIFGKEREAVKIVVE